MSEEENKAPVILPARYYLDYFKYLLDFVESMYADILSDAEVFFLTEFRNLSEDAQCLFVRLSNRKGAFYRTNSLGYPEIGNIQKAVNELMAKAFTESLSQSHALRLPEVLEVTTKPDLMIIVELLQPAILPLRSIRKPDLVRWLLHEYPSEGIIEVMAAKYDLIKVAFEMEVMMLKFLFFGNRHDDMTEFVVRDLGLIKYQAFQEENYSVKFSTRKDAEDTLRVSLTSQSFEEMKEEAVPDEIFHWFIGWQALVNENLSIIARPSFERLILKVAGFLERKKLLIPAFETYQLTDKPPSRERRVRLLTRLGLPNEAIALGKEILNSPQNADERFFAEDYFARNIEVKRIKRTTRALKDAEEIAVGREFMHNVENGAIEYYKTQGFEAFFSENEVWRALFGLLFWDIIYDTNVNAIHHPLQRVPSDFFLPDFYVKRSETLLARLDELDDSEKTLTLVSNKFEEKFGLANVLVFWRESLLAELETIIRLLTPTQLSAILMEMAGNLKENVRGFPDLLVHKGTEYSFVEIKSPNDHLSSQQLHWQYFLNRHGVKCKVVRVRWE